MMISLDGYFEGENHDLSWHNANNNEFQQFAKENLKYSDSLLMGHRTYKLMKAYWPTSRGITDDPATAQYMNQTQKFVVSRNKFNPGWKKVTVLHKDPIAEIRLLKKRPGKDIALLGSNNLLVSLLEEKLVDELRVMVNPVAIGRGTPLFHGLKKRADFKLTGVTKFSSGNALLNYKIK